MWQPLCDSAPCFPTALCGNEGTAGGIYVILFFIYKGLINRNTKLSVAISWGINSQLGLTVLGSALDHQAFLLLINSHKMPCASMVIA